MSTRTELTKARILMERAEREYKAAEDALLIVRRRMEARQIEYSKLLRDSGLCANCGQATCDCYPALARAGSAGHVTCIAVLGESTQ